MLPPPLLWRALVFKIVLLQHSILSDIQIIKDVSTKLGRRSFGHLNHIKDIREVQDV